VSLRKIMTTALNFFSAKVEYCCTFLSNFYSSWLNTAPLLLPQLAYSSFCNFSKCASMPMDTRSFFLILHRALKYKRVNRRASKKPPHTNITLSTCSHIRRVNVFISFLQNSSNWREMIPTTTLERERCYEVIL
jgi:hypothetical protein